MKVCCPDWSRFFQPVSVKLAIMKKEIPALTQSSAKSRSKSAAQSADKTDQSAESAAPDAVDATVAALTLDKGQPADSPAQSPAQPAEAGTEPQGDAVPASETPQDAHLASADERPATAESVPDADQAAAPPPPPTPPAPQSTAPVGPPAPSKVPLVLSVLALLIAAASGWQMFEQRTLSKELRDELAQRLNAADVGMAEVRANSRQNQEALASLQSRLGGFDAKLAATEGQAAALEALYQEYSRSRGDQVLAEVEQAINIASQQLQLAGNFEAALIALEGADARLSAPDQAHLQALRRALLKDLDAVRAHPRVDVSGLALRMENLLEKLDTLPLAHDYTLNESSAIGSPAEAQGAVPEEAGLIDQGLHLLRGVAGDVWGEVRGMIRLERLDHTDPALLAPAQSTFLRENVKIRLLTARLALLSRDARTYTADLAQARDWLGRYFDPNDAEVVKALADLDELGKIVITAQAPTLEDTFAALRLVQARASAPAQR